MSLEFMLLNGYGLYVWPAFIFTFVSCFYLYIKTKKELQRQEKMFLNENKKFKSVKIKITKQIETAKVALSDGLTF